MWKDWFKFGVVRGALGLVIGGLILGGLHNAGLVQGCGVMSIVNILAHILGPLALPVIAIFVLLANGATYAFGSKIVEWLNLHGKGLKAVLLVAVVGITVINITVFLTGSLILSIITGTPLVIAFLFMLPWVTIIEAGMAVLTYVLYVFAKDVLEINAVESLSV